MKYKILSHIADLRLEVYGKTLEEIFTNAAEALADILYKKIKKVSTLKEEIKIESGNSNALLVDFLNEILSRSQINKAVYLVEKISISDNGVSAGISGTPVTEFSEDVKAVTYHEAEIKKEKGIFKTKLILDI